MTIEVALAAPVASGLVTALGILWSEYKAEKKQNVKLQEEVKKEKQEKLDQYKFVSKEVTDLCKSILKREDKVGIMAERLEKQIDKLEKYLDK